MPSVFIINPNPEYERMFWDMNWDVELNPEQADLIQFTGGADVSPDLYGQEPHAATWADSQRDHMEGILFASTLERQPMAGICRGAQFLNVKSGGSMYQHVDNHGISGTHGVYDMYTSNVIQCSSTHHQMMRPGPSAAVVGVAQRSTYRQYMDGSDIVEYGGWTSDEPDAEVLYYPLTKSLCFQPHPEFRGLSACRDYYFELLARYFNL
jgi:hypothetical protein